MEDAAIRILDVVTEYSDLGDLNGKNREDVIGWITEILEGYTNSFELGNKVTNTDLASPNYRKDGIIIDRSTDLTPQIYLVKYGDGLEEYDWVDEEKLVLTESTLELRANYELYKKWADKQLDSMANQIEKKDEIIRELSELLIKLSGKME